MSGGLVDKVYIGLDNAPAAFDIKGRILGPVSNRNITIGIQDLQVFINLRFNFRMELTWSTSNQKRKW